MDPYTSSVIHEYRVLYSTRIVQKDKKWCDGLLRFYEVNNKVEIVNPTQLLLVSDFIGGSMSFVLEEMLVEGHEFKLPNKPFLVMVDEKIGASVRDVSHAIRAKKEVVVVNRPLMKTETNASDQLMHVNTKIKTEPISPKARRRIGMSRPTERSKISIRHNPVKREQQPPNRLVRIPPMSSTIFRYLNCYN